MTTNRSVPGTWNDHRLHRAQCISAGCASLRACPWPNRRGGRRLLRHMCVNLRRSLLFFVSIVIRTWMWSKVRKWERERDVQWRYWHRSNLFLLDVRARARVRAFVCGAGPVSSVVLHIEKKVKERESECIKYKCVYIRIQTQRERERMKAVKKNTLNRGLHSRCARSFFLFFFNSTSRCFSSFLYCPSDRCCGRCRFVHSFIHLYALFLHIPFYVIVIIFFFLLVFKWSVHVDDDDDEKFEVKNKYPILLCLCLSPSPSRSLFMPNLCKLKNSSWRHPTCSLSLFSPRFC